jgi:hypothetical protein
MEIFAPWFLSFKVEPIENCKDSTKTCEDAKGTSEDSKESYSYSST